GREAGRDGPNGEASKAGSVLLKVRDTGIGIRPELLPHVFDMFTQGERTTEQGRGGLGVGLTLVRSLVQMHGGNIEVHSAGTGQGTEFIVRLPFAEGPPPPAAPRPAKP